MQKYVPNPRPELQSRYLRNYYAQMNEGSGDFEKFHLARTYQRDWRSICSSSSPSPFAALMVASLVCVIGSVIIAGLMHCNNQPAETKKVAVAESTSHEAARRRSSKNDKRRHHTSRTGSHAYAIAHHFSDEVGEGRVNINQIASAASNSKPDDFQSAATSNSNQVESVGQVAASVVPSAASDTATEVVASTTAQTRAPILLNADSSTRDSQKISSIPSSPAGQMKVKRSNEKDSLAPQSILVDQLNHRIMTGKTFIKYSADATINVDRNGIISMKYGDIVVDTQTPLLLKLGTDRMLVKNKCTALISIRDGAIKVRNLQENHAFSADVFISKRRFGICAGEELVATADFDSLQSTANEDHVKRRNVRTFELKDGTQIMCAEFSPINVIKQNPVLKSLAFSEDKTESKVFGRVMKMAACLAVVTRSHGDYAPIAGAQTQQVAFSNANQ